MNEKTKVSIARGGVIACGVAAWVLALSAESIFELVHTASEWERRLFYRRDVGALHALGRRASGDGHAHHGNGGLAGGGVYLGNTSTAIFFRWQFHWWFILRWHWRKGSRDGARAVEFTRSD